jgi:uncharacterized protein with HEPN domain
MPRSDIAYLRHILDAINRIEEYYVSTAIRAISSILCKS